VLWTGDYQPHKQVIFSRRQNDYQRHRQMKATKAGDNQRRRQMKMVIISAAGR
jgi:hypothetical protein